ncbi:hypothetical protein D3C75_543500 [compost metagenome]
MNHTVPASPASPHTQKICQQILANVNAVWVKSEPLPGAPEKECFQIVADHVVRHGGKAITGWAIWEVPGVYIEAEYHSIWQDADGVLHDLTPYPHKFDKILFLPDHTRPYCGRQMDNFRQAVVNDRDVYRWLYLAKRCFELTNAGDLADQHGEIRLAPKAAKEYWKIMGELSKLQSRLDRRY